MTGVDYGSSCVKWFNGKEFGIGTPQGRSFTLGLSSSHLLVKESFFPVCTGGKLKRLILNDVATDLSLEPEELTVAFCEKEKVDKGCLFLIFVERRKRLEELPQELVLNSQVTVDLIGGVTAGLTFSESFTLVDAGKGKVSVCVVEGGKLSRVEVLRGGVDYHVERGEAFRLVEEVATGEVLLVGGGAFSDEFKGELSKVVDFKVPILKPFGEKTPLYFNAYGLYSFRKSPCKALFKNLSPFSQELLKEKGKLLFTASATFLSLLLITGGVYLNYLSAKRDYYAYRRSAFNELSSLLGEKILAPEIQIPQKLEEYRGLSEFLRVDSPSLLYYLKAISSSVVKGVKVLSVDGSLSSGQFTLKGKAEGDSLKVFVQNLKGKFRRVSVTSTKEGSSGVKFTVKLEVGSGG